MTAFAAQSPNSSPSPEPLLTPSMLVLSSVMVTAMGGFYLLLSAVPAHAAALGGDVAAGLATGALMATTIAGELVAPRVIARFGRRTTMTVALVVLAIPCATTFSGSVALVLLSCILRGFGLGVLLVAACGLAAALAPPMRRAEAMGIYGVASAIPAILCVPLGPWALGEFGTAAIAATAAVMTLSGLAGLAFLASGNEQDKGERHSHRLPEWHGAAWPTVSLALSATVVGVTITFLPLSHREVGTGTIMLALFIQGLTSAAARWAAGGPIDRHGPQSPMMAGTALAVSAVLCLALPGQIAVLGGMALSGVAFGVVQSASLAQLMNRSAPGQADGASALWNAAYDAGLGIGGVTFGILATTTGYAGAFVAAGGGAAVVAFLVFRAFEATRATC